MSQNAIKYIVKEGDKDFPLEGFYPQKGRDTYISANRDFRGSGSRERKEHKPFTTSPARFGKQDNIRNQQTHPPRATPFQRSRNVSIERKDSQLSQIKSLGKGRDQDRREILRFSQLKKKLDEEMQERERLQQINACQEMKLVNLTEQINKLRVQKKQLQRVILQLQKAEEVSILNLSKANQNIQQLTRNLKEARINQKSLTNLKNLQNQIEYLQERNKKLLQENKELGKSIKIMKADMQKQTKESSSSSQCSTKTEEIESRAVLGQLLIARSEREHFLQKNFHELEKKLFEKQSEIKKLQIQLNCIDRKKVLSINEVKNKKDQEIKDLRQRFIKVSKDLKETKDKFEKNEKKQCLKDNAFLRKVKSSKNLGITSESEEVTFEFSSEA